MAFNPKNVLQDNSENYTENGGEGGAPDRNDDFGRASMPPPGRTDTNLFK